MDYREKDGWKTGKVESNTGRRMDGIQREGWMGKREKVEWIQGEGWMGLREKDEWVKRRR